jgi:hypothetical protein
MNLHLAPAILRARPVTDERLAVANTCVPSAARSRRAACVLGVVLLACALLAVADGTALAVDYPGFIPMVTDPQAVFSIPPVKQPAYLDKMAEPTFGTAITRISGPAGSAVNGLPALWGPIVRHNYSTQQPWNSAMLLLALDNDGGSPNASTIIVGGGNYLPRYLPCPGYARYDWRWHPLTAHRNEQINVNQAGTELMWYDVTTCTKTRSWPLPIVANYGIGSGEGNPSNDGRYVVIANDSQMVVVDMDPQPPLAPYPNLRIGPVYAVPRCTLDVAQPGVGQMSHVALSPSGKYIDYKYAGMPRLGQLSCDTLCDVRRIFKIEDDLSIHVQNMADNSLRCGSFANRPNGWIFPLKHGDMAYDPSDGDEEVIIGGRACPGSTLGRVVKVRLRDGKVMGLTDPNNEPPYEHGSARNIDRPGWFYVTYSGDSTELGSRFFGEVVAVKTDGSGEVQRFAHYHSTQSVYLSQVQAVPSPDGRRVLINSDWCEGTPGPCPQPNQVQSYVVDARAGALLDAPATPQPRELRLSPPSPNPSREGLILRLSLPSGRPAALELFDVTGRRVSIHNVGVLGAGDHVVDLDAEHRLPTGVYLVTLTDGHASRTTKAVLLR